MRRCEEIEIVEFKTRHPTGEQPFSQYSASSMLADVPSGLSMNSVASAMASNCPSPDDFSLLNVENSKKTKKLVKKKSKDGKSSSPKVSRVSF